MTDWAKALKLAEDEIDRIKEKKKPSSGKEYEMPSGVAGTTTGQVVPHDNEKFQRRRQGSWLRRRGKFESTSKDFGKATPEQIALRQKKEAREALIEARKKERRHRGGYKKTAAYKAKMARANDKS